MKRSGRPRRDAIVALCPKGAPGNIVVDVGADHGRIAQRIGAIATERMPHRRSGVTVRWVIADGLRPFRHVDGVVIAGMGARTIGRILSEGPTPSWAVLHAQDDPITLRHWLAAHGYRIEAEGLAEEAGRFAEICRVRPGEETSTGRWLSFGPRLLRDGAPHLQAHLEELRTYYTDLAQQTQGHEVHQTYAGHAAFLDARLAELVEPDG
ncbi:MAG: tRNA (adenine(22)-N(1))-methyltransferase TrmK [Myxococcota bacterium]